MFLFQMVFMDTALDHRDRHRRPNAGSSPAFLVSLVPDGRLHLSAVRQLGLGRRLARHARQRTSAWATATADFAGSGVVHAVGGLTALALAIIIGPRIGKYTRDGKPNAIPATTSCIVLTGLLHPGLRLVRLQSRLDAGRFRQRQPAHRLGRGQHHAGRHGRVASAPCSTCGCATASPTPR